MLIISAKTSSDSSKYNWFDGHWRDKVDLLYWGNFFRALTFMPICPPVKWEVWNLSILDKVGSVPSSFLAQRVFVSICSKWSIGPFGEPYLQLCLYLSFLFPLTLFSVYLSHFLPLCTNLSLHCLSFFLLIFASDLQPTLHWPQVFLTLFSFNLIPCTYCWVVNNLRSGAMFLKYRDFKPPDFFQNLSFFLVVKKKYVFISQNLSDTFIKIVSNLALLLSSESV